MVFGHLDREQATLFSADLSLDALPEAQTTDIRLRLTVGISLELQRSDLRRFLFAML
jgi:hypothetical protein